MQDLELHNLLINSLKQYNEIEKLLVQYNNILVCLDISIEDISTQEILHSKKKDILSKFITLLNIQNRFDENKIIEIVEDYLISYM